MFSQRIPWLFISELSQHVFSIVEPVRQKTTDARKRLTFD
jgi:hypothetical protein